MRDWLRKNYIEIIGVSMTILVISLIAFALMVQPAGESETDQLRRQLAQACHELDEMSFDGDPMICLDPEGKPFNR